MITIPHASLDRLSRLHLACDKRSGLSLNHIALTIVGDTVRIAATDGRVLVCALFEAEGETDREIVLDGEQFTAACKAALKSRVNAVHLLIGHAESRLETRHGDSLVRHIDGTFPPLEAILRKHSAGTWIPSVSAIEPALLARGQKIIGRPALTLSSPVTPGSSLPCAWESQHPTPVTTHELGQATRTPAFWTDGQWLVLLMPTTRILPPALDMAAFVCARRAEMAVA